MKLVKCLLVQSKSQAKAQFTRWGIRLHDLIEGDTILPCKGGGYKREEPFLQYTLLLNSTYNVLGNLHFHQILQEPNKLNIKRLNISAFYCVFFFNIFLY